jgi:hypothetical protein
MTWTRTNPFRWILWTWIGYVFFFLFAALYVGPDDQALSNGVIDSTNAFLAIVSIELFKREIGPGSKAVFFNFVLFFGLNAIYPVQLLLHSVLLRLDKYSQVYFYQYSLAWYFLLLPLCIVFMLTHTVLPSWRTIQKYAVSLLVVGSVWIFQFFPYLADPRFLYSTAEVEHYRQIDAAIQSLEEAGHSRPGSREISPNVRLFEGKRGESMRELLGEEKEKRIAELLPYMDGSNHTALVMKPLFLAALYMSMFSLLAVVSFLVYQYLIDPPKAAYLEKMVLVFLPYCSFEVLHFYIFSTTHSVDRLFANSTLGQYFSFATMLLMAFVFGMRLKFILSIEGRFYERHLMSDSRRITRWRDAFDNWVLRQFMDAGEIERRFAVNPRVNDKESLTDQHHDDSLKGPR